MIKKTGVNILNIVQPLSAVMLAVLTSATCASAETNITCSYKDGSIPYVIDEEKREIRRVDMEETMTTLLFHDDFIMFDVSIIGKPYKNPPDIGSGDGLFMVTRAVLDRRSGKMNRQSIIKFQLGPTTKTFDEVWDCSLDGKQF